MACAAENRANWKEKKSENLVTVYESLDVDPWPETGNNNC